MKNLFNIALMAILAICLASCEKEQSSFQISDIKTSALIKGKLLYHLGQDYKGGEYIENIKPAEGKKVYVEVKNTEYANNDARGVAIFEATTDAEGSYSINIPVLYSNTEATIKAEPFIDTYKRVIDVKDGVPVYEETETIFYIEGNTRSLSPNDIVFWDKMYSTDERGEDPRYEYISKFTVKVGEPKYKIETNEYDEEVIERYYAPKADIDVIATINDVNYGATTNNKGEATFIIPSKEKAWDTSISLKTTPYIVNAFQHFEKHYETRTGTRIVEKETYGQYYNEETGSYEWGLYTYEVEETYEYQVPVIEKYQIESGIMSYFRQDKSKIRFSGIQDDKTPIINVALGFTPHEDVESYEYDESDWYYIDLNF